MMDWKAWIVPDLRRFGTPPDLHTVRPNGSEKWEEICTMWTLCVLTVLDLRIGLSRYRRLLRILRLNFKCGPYVNLLSSEWKVRRWVEITSQSNDLLFEFCDYDHTLAEFLCIRYSRIILNVSKCIAVQVVFLFIFFTLLSCRMNTY